MQFFQTLRSKSELSKSLLNKSGSNKNLSTINQFNNIKTIKLNSAMNKYKINTNLSPIKTKPITQLNNEHQDNEKDYSVIIKGRANSIQNNQKNESKIIEVSNFIKNEQNPNITKSNGDVKEKLTRIYEFYCQYGERTNVNMLKSMNYQKFALDSGILDNKITKTRLELISSSIIKSKSKSFMNFEDFLKCLIKIAEFKYIIKNETSKYSNTSNSALLTLMKNHIYPLYDQLFENKEHNTDIFKSSVDKKDINSSMSFLGDKDTSYYRINVTNQINVEDLITDNQLEELLTCAAPVLYFIYKVYFPWELSQAEDINFIKDKSSKAFLTFIIDFDICPSLIPKSSAVQIYQSEIKSKVNKEIFYDIIKNVEVISMGRCTTKNTLGQHFDFLKFIKILCFIGNHSFEKIEANKWLPLQKISLLFERMQLSEGFSCIESKTSTTHSIKRSYIVPLEVFDKIRATIPNDNESVNISNIQDETLHRKLKLRKSIVSNFKNIFEHSNYILGKYANKLQLIFKYYCSFGDPMNTLYMKSNKFLKFLKESNLLKNNYSHFQEPGLKTSDVDIIFVKLSNNSENNLLSSSLNGTINTNFNTIVEKKNSPIKERRNSFTNSGQKLEFVGFINAIEIISLLLYPDTEELLAIDTVINGKILPLLDKFEGKSNNLLNQVINERESNPKFVIKLNKFFRIR